MMKQEPSQTAPARLPNHRQLDKTQILALQMLCEMTYRGACVSARQWKNTTASVYGADRFWVDALAERGLVALKDYSRSSSIADLAPSFGWIVTDWGREILVQNGGDPNVTSNLWRAKPIRSSAARW